MIATCPHCGKMIGLELIATPLAHASSQRTIVSTEATKPSSSTQPDAPRMFGKLALSVPEAAELLGIGRSAAYQVVQRHELPSLRIGRRRLIPVRGLLDYLNKQEGKS